MGEEGVSKKIWKRPEMLILMALLGVALAWGGLCGYRMVLEHRLETLRLEVERIESEARRDREFAIRCPPVVELDPAWAGRMPWGAGREEALPLLDGGQATVQVHWAGGGRGPALAWNAEYRVYDLTADHLSGKGPFWIAVMLQEGGWAFTVPSNWPLPVCDPWVDCRRGDCEEGCAPEEFPQDWRFPPASLPPLCRRD